MPTRLRSSQGSGQFCIMAFCICHLPLLAWRLPFGKEVSSFLYGKFPHFPHYFPHFPYGLLFQSLKDRGLATPNAGQCVQNLCIHSLLLVSFIRSVLPAFL